MQGCAHLDHIWLSVVLCNQGSRSCSLHQGPGRKAAAYDQERSCLVREQAIIASEVPQQNGFGQEFLFLYLESQWAGLAWFCLGRALPRGTVSRDGGAVQEV